MNFGKSSEEKMVEAFVESCPFKFVFSGAAGTRLPPPPPLFPEAHHPEAHPSPLPLMCFGRISLWGYLWDGDVWYHSVGDLDGYKPAAADGEGGVQGNGETQLQLRQELYGCRGDLLWQRVCHRVGKVSLFPIPKFGTIDPCLPLMSQYSFFRPSISIVPSET